METVRSISRKCAWNFTPELLQKVISSERRIQWSLSKRASCFGCLTGLKCQCLKSMKLNITSDAKCAERFEVIIAQLAPTHFFKSVSMMLQQEVMTQGVVQAVVLYLASHIVAKKWCIHQKYRDVVYRQAVGSKDLSSS
nr:protein RRNAD1-like isoform X2 [Biomphalaria glabrata]